MGKKRTGRSGGKVITIIDIARDAGVSPSTVSRVLSGNPRVDAAMRAAVEAAAKRLNYRPNMVAQGLVRGRSNTIGVLTQNMNSLFYGEMVIGIEQQLYQTGYFPLLASGNWNLPNLPTELDALDVLLGRQIDGLIILGGQLPDERLQGVAAQLPLILVGRTAAGLEDRCLQIDNYQGAYSAVQYLLQSGHTRIAHITGKMVQTDAQARYAGYCAALEDAGVGIDPQLIVEGTFQEQGGIQAIEVLLERGVQMSAVFAANDPLAYGARLALFRHGIRVPDDISLVGFDDQSNSVYCIPPLTTVRQPALEMGAAAAAAMLRLLAGEPLGLPTIATELVIRESTRQR
jgi:LacI family transcriptional regulator